MNRVCSIGLTGAGEREKKDIGYLGTVVCFEDNNQLICLNNTNFL